MFTLDSVLNVQNAETSSIEKIRDIVASIFTMSVVKSSTGTYTAEEQLELMSRGGGIYQAHHEEGGTKCFQPRRGNEACHLVRAYSPASSEGATSEGRQPHDKSWGWARQTLEFDNSV